MKMGKISTNFESRSKINFFEKCFLRLRKNSAVRVADTVAGEYFQTAMRTFFFLLIK